MKVLIYAADALWCQKSRIEQGFKELGHEMVNDPIEADLIYANDYARYGVALTAKTLNPAAKLILTVLDVPLHNADTFDFKGIGEQLRVADGLASISEFTQSQVKKHFELDSTVIYQPIMPVEKLENPEKLYRYLFVGRKYDQNKRVGVGVHALWLLGVKSNEVGMVGHEPVDWGVNLGLVPTELLSKVYNGADFSLSLGLVEGLNLPLIEAMAAGVIPIVCRDLTTRNEFLPSDLFPEYGNVEANASSIAVFIAQFMQDNDAKQRMKDRIHSHYKKNLEEKFKPISVAKKIIEIYGRL